MAVPTQSSAGEAAADTRPPAKHLSECPGEKLVNLDRTLWDMFSKAAVDRPNNDAIVSMWQTDTTTTPPSDGPYRDADNPEYLRWSYSELYKRSIVLSSWLQKRGCELRTRVAAFLWNSAEWGLFLWTSAKLGMVYAPLDPRLLASEGTFFLEATSPAVVVAQDAAEAAALESHLPKDSSSIIVRIQCSGDIAVAGWTLLREIWAGKTTAEADIVHERGNASSGDTALIVFTSGTTSIPKGCPHTHMSLAAQMHTYDPNPDPTFMDRWLVHTPASHIFAVNNALRAWGLGHAVILPSKAFDIGATLKALVHEQCTIMSAVPTLVKAILGNPLFPGKKALNLSIVTIGGTLITPEDIRLCREGLGAKDAIQAFGMSEGAPVISWTRSDPLLKDGYHPGVGKTLPGANTRICVPGTREVVARNQVGELHIGGPPVIEGYLGGVESQSLYTDAVGNWLVTGDQARMDEDGVIYILGRYKDVIIRGGENIPPLKLETTIGGMGAGIVAQVVGLPDEIAGQVSVAVVKIPETAEVSKTEIMATCRELGPMYALGSVYLLSELGMETFPMTSLGKIKKEVLKEAVLALRLHAKVKERVSTVDVQPTAPINGHNGLNRPEEPLSIADQLVTIWEELIGVRPGVDDSVSSFADSISLLRYCDRVFSVLVLRLFLQDFTKNDTIAKQAALLTQRAEQQDAIKKATNGLGKVAFSPARMDHPMTNGVVQQNGVHKPKAADLHISSALPKSPKSSPIKRELDLHSAAISAVASTGFEQSDIENAIRIKDSFHRLAIGTRPQSYHTRLVFRVVTATIAQVRRGIETALSTRPIFRTMIAQLPDGTPFHIVITPCSSLFDGMIETLEVSHTPALESITKDGSAEGHTSPWMARFQIVQVQESTQTFLIATYNQSIIDALSLQTWHLDLDRLIQNPEYSVPLLSPFKPFADLLHLYRSSVPAQASVAYNVSRLRGISRFRDALWPVQRAPGWMIADDCSTSLEPERALIRNQVWKGQWDSFADEFQIPRIARVSTLSGMERLQSVLQIDPCIVMKTAIAIFNVLQTGSRYAIFNSYHSARSWPFVPAWIEAVLPSAESIGGPTAEWTVELCEVLRRESVADLLKQMGLEHNELERHAHAPWEKVLEGLRDEEAEVAVDASFRQSFVWDVNMGLGTTRGYSASDEKVLDIVARYDWPDCGLVWTAFMVDKSNLFFIASWDTAQLSLEEVEGHCNTMASVLRQLVNEENWNKPVAEVFSC
ncbi:hypothetical protein B0H66DRAFT_106255 [Apodospora peruviana]|uniref:AMP-dependent synthetase/ligase domain-containing protein n=1 Tax=Apodospora peruviana TaxID=516989 RepID=A0AAE0M9Z7_9PEZI|nr:hypothetical protein B0H66DRAFT_106255 [Apodospora peruviana]